MAKKNQSSKRKVAVFSVKGWDAAHYKTTDQYAKAVERIMVATTTEISGMVAKKNIDTDKPFKFSDYPAIQKEVNRAVDDMAKSITVTIERGSRKEWLSASQKNDAFIQSVMNTSKVSKARLSKMQDKNLDALAAFQSRKVEGMDLSQRVWKYAGQFKDQIEQCIDVGLGEGRSADELSRDVRQNLKDPNRLFRRVRDKRGNLVLSKNARAFHPGQGVYRSSYKNAMRLTRSEINMAYRESDYLRWQQLDFVIGIEIHRSNHDPLCDCDLCARLVGKYPKTFKFKGWHPQCMCYATPVLVSDDEFDAQELSDLKSALYGTEYRKLAVKGEITDVPDGFKDWVKENTEKQKGWSSTPYFIKDNFVDGELAKGLKPAALAVPNRVEPEPAKPVVQNTEPTPVETEEMKKARWERFSMEKDADDEWIDACRYYDISAVEEWLQKFVKARWEHDYTMLDELESEFNRIDAILKSEIEKARTIVKNGIDAFAAACADAGKWIGEPSTTKYLAILRNGYADKSAMKYPEFKSLANSVTIGLASPGRLQGQVDAAKTRYNNAIANANAAMQKFPDADLTKLKSLVNEQMTLARPAIDIADDIAKAINEVERSALGLTKYANELETKGVAYNEVKMHSKQPTEQEMIDTIGGGDMTSGSCSSLAFTWAANRGGMNVLDFRGGNSMSYFSSGFNIRKICEAVGGINEYMSGIEAMKMTVVGKEYYLAIGRHAAIVRQVAPKQYEYLELQSGVAGWNGWHKLTAAEFSRRFSARGREYAQLIDVELLYKNKDYQKIMGYINTAESEQKKGSRGTVK